MKPLIFAMILVVSVIGLPAWSRGQENPNQTSDADRAAPTPALSGVVGIDSEETADETQTNLPQIPTLLGGPRMSLSVGGEQGRSNYLRGGINVGVAYDDNVHLDPRNSQGTPIYSVFPNIALEQTTSRIQTRLAYAGGITINQELSDSNQGAHDFSFDTQYRLSPHANLHVAEDFYLTTGLFDSGIGSNVANGGGVTNPSIITPLARERSSSTVVETNYQFSLNDVIGGSGSYNALHFSDVPVGTQLVDSQTASASAFWFHGLFRRDWAGVSYRFDRLTFEPSGGETLVHSIFVVNTLTLSRHVTISAFVGPEYSDNRGVAASGPNAGSLSEFSEWSAAGGVEAGWRNDKTSFAGGFSSRVSNGAGLLGVSRTQAIHGDFRRELSPGWIIGLNAAYAKNRALTVPVAGSSTDVDNTTVGASVERNIGRRLGVRLSYSHDFQQQGYSAVPLQTLDAHRNRVSLTLGYQWAKALGR